MYFNICNKSSTKLTVHTFLTSKSKFKLLSKFDVDDKIEKLTSLKT